MKTIREWGFDEILLQTDYTIVKEVTINPKEKTTYHYLNNKIKNLVVVKGYCTIIFDGDKLFRYPGETIKIPIGVLHRIINEFDEPLIIIETQTGQNLTDDDMVKLINEDG